MIIALSACLLGENCKYNGSNNYNRFLADYLKGHEVVPICPEVLGGLPVPREPVEIVGEVVRRRDGGSVDAAFRAGAQAALEKVKAAGAELVILQSRSPSCGVGTIYDGTFTGTLTAGDGIFAALLKENGIPVIDVAAFESEHARGAGD
ncbi:MAG: DUF523 domain-containing protein [Clostridia bacterium]|nr:DUF523 domain-containing protein [Clostridia bacterium]